MVSKNAFKALIASALVLVTAPVLAAKGLNYTYVDAGYEYTSVDDQSMSLKTATVDGSFDVFKYVALRGGFKRGIVKGRDRNAGNSSDPDYFEFQAGARGHYNLIEKLDLFAGATWFYNSINGSSNRESSKADSGGIFDAGIRYAPFKRFELDLSARTRQPDTGPSDTVLMVNPIIKITKKFSLNLRAEQLGDNDAYFAGIRLKL